MDWSGLERLASAKDELGIWVWAHERYAGGAAEKVLAELRAEPDPFEEDYGAEDG